MRTSDTLPTIQIFYEVTKDSEVVGYQKKRCCSNSKRLAPKQKQSLLPWFHLEVDELKKERVYPKTVNQVWWCYSYNACRLPAQPYSKARTQTVKSGEKILNFSKSQKKPVCRLWFWKGKALNNHQAAKFWHRLSASEQERLFEIGSTRTSISLHKIYTLNSYYDATNGNWLRVF